MKHLLAGLLSLALLVPGMVLATSSAPIIEVHDAWIRLLPGDLPAGGYMTLENVSDDAQQLLSVTSVEFGHIMLHQSMHDHGMSHMQELDGVTIPAHDTVSFVPGGYHLMLMDRQQPVEIGQTIVLTLHFADGHSLDVAFKLRPANATGL